MVSGSHRPLLRHWGRDAWNVSCSLQYNGRRGRKETFTFCLQYPPELVNSTCLHKSWFMCRKGRSKRRGGPISSRRRADPTSIRNHRRVRTEESTTQFMDPPLPDRRPFALFTSSSCSFNAALSSASPPPHQTSYGRRSTFFLLVEPPEPSDSSNKSHKKGKKRRRSGIGTFLGSSPSVVAAAAKT